VKATKLAWSSLPVLLVAAVLLATPASAQILPKLTVGVEEATTPSEVAVTLEIIFLITILSLAPTLLVMLTSFTRMTIVLSFLRRAIGTNQAPSNQLVVGLSLFLTAFLMMPVWTRINENALQPYLAESIDHKEALTQAQEPLREFMLKQTREKDLALFLRLAKKPNPAVPTEVGNVVLIPAFITSELKTAFQIGFVLFLPFLVIDMVLASVLMSMGMLMLPPVMVSFPFKILLFVLVDGWYLVVESLISSFH
jgi:flagellar biosynthetic protein FliP